MRGAAGSIESRQGVSRESTVTHLRPEEHKHAVEPTLPLIRLRTLSTMLVSATTPPMALGSKGVNIM